MPISFQKLMSDVVRCFPTEVLLPDALLRKRGTLNSFIGSSFSSFYVEWHCVQPERSDLLCSLTYENRMLVLNRLPKVRKRGLTKDNWTTLADFLRHWEGLELRLAGVLPHIWLAFDYNVITHKYDPPNIHFCIDKKFADRNLKPGYVNKLSVKRFNKILATLGEVIAKEHSAPVFRLLSNYYRSIAAAGGEVLHLSLMHSRTPAWAKLNVTVPSPELPELLESLGWPCSGIVKKLCRKFAKDMPRIKGNITLTGDVFSRFEIELEYNSPLLGNPRRQQMLKALEYLKVATPQTICQLEKWSGKSDCGSLDGRPLTIERWLDVKICIDRNGMVIVKPYFGFAPAPGISWNRNGTDDKIAQ